MVVLKPLKKRPTCSTSFSKSPKLFRNQLSVETHLSNSNGHIVGSSMPHLGHSGTGCGKVQGFHPVDNVRTNIPRFFFFLEISRVPQFARSIRLHYFFDVGEKQQFTTPIPTCMAEHLSN